MAYLHPRQFGAYLVEQHAAVVIGALGPIGPAAGAAHPRQGAGKLHGVPILARTECLYEFALTPAPAWQQLPYALHIPEKWWSLYFVVEVQVPYAILDGRGRELLGDFLGVAVAMDRVDIAPVKAAE